MYAYAFWHVTCSIGQIICVHLLLFFCSLIIFCSSILKPCLKGILFGYLDCSGWLVINISIIHDTSYPFTVETFLEDDDAFDFEEEPEPSVSCLTFTPFANINKLSLMKLQNFSSLLSWGMELEVVGSFTVMQSGKKKHCLLQMKLWVHSMGSCNYMLLRHLPTS